MEIAPNCLDERYSFSKRVMLEESEVYAKPNECGTAANRGGSAAMPARTIEIWGVDFVPVKVACASGSGRRGEQGVPRSLSELPEPWIDEGVSFVPVKRGQMDDYLVPVISGFFLESQ